MAITVGSPEGHSLPRALVCHRIEVRRKVVRRLRSVPVWAGVRHDAPRRAAFIAADHDCPSRGLGHLRQDPQECAPELRRLTLEPPEESELLQGAYV